MVISDPPPSDPAAIPVFLLKTKSTPTDAYEDILSSQASSLNDNSTAPNHQCRFSPSFIPVLLHRFEEHGLSRFRSLLQTDNVSTRPDAAFGGLIFTSQRAVEALASLVDEHPSANLDIPIYSVGPATTRALKAIPRPSTASTALDIVGEHTGNGDALAHFILGHYNSHCRSIGVQPSRPLLFPVGEQRRDIIPKTLMDASMPADRRIEVVEEVVYGTGVMESFPKDFAAALRDTQDAPERWVVVFSPTGCDSMLSCLGLIDRDNGRAKQEPGSRDGRTFVATIGPTTRKHLQTMFGFEPDVCAEKPSPEGVLQGILDYKARRP